MTDLVGKKVNFGGPGDGISITGPAIFNLIKVRAEVTAYPPPLAIEKLRSGEIAALACVGGKIAASPVPDDRQLREIFSKFLDERSRLVGGGAMSAQEKDNMFNQFQRWQSSQSR